MISHLPVENSEVAFFLFLFKDRAFPSELDRLFHPNGTIISLLLLDFSPIKLFLSDRLSDLPLPILYTIHCPSHTHHGFDDVRKIREAKLSRRLLPTEPASRDLNYRGPSSYGWVRGTLKCFEAFHMRAWTLSHGSPSPPLEALDESVVPCSLSLASLSFARPYVYNP